jgi:hypothetical protein
LTANILFKGTNVTLDIFESIRAVVQLIAEEQHISFEEAYLFFSRTDLYQRLKNPYTVYWAEDPLFLLDELHLELEEKRQQK